jgi:hypothetical protein
VGPDVAIQWEAHADGQKPSLAARRSLQEWAEARGFHLVEPAGPPLPAIVPDAVMADAVEEEIERARDATTALDTAAAERALTKADALLGAHPELPEAAWLEAEVLRAWGTRWQRLAPRDEPRSRTAWARAAALDGGRATGLGEVAATTKTANVTAALSLPSPLDGEPEREVTRLDGVVVQGSTLVAPGGQHQLTVSYDGALVWAGWVTLDDGKVVRVTLPEPSACAGQDLARARLVNGTVVATGVLCGEWVFAEEAPSATGELFLASCEEGQCGAPFRWRVGAFGPVLPPSRRGVEHWPVWATWVIIGASAAAIGGATLAATGVFRPTHDEPVLTTGGLHTSAATIPLRIGE